LAREGLLQFRCASCCKEYTLDPRRIPPAGAKGPCRQCGAALEVHPDGSVVGAVISVAASAKPPRPSPAQPPVPRPPPPPVAQPAASPAPKIQPSPLEPGTFRCPSCGHLHRADLSRVPTVGATGKCGRCGAGLTLLPDGTLRGARAGSAPAGTAEASSWEIEKEGQALGPFSTEEMRELVALGRLLPDNLVRPAGGEWTLLAACPLLASALQREAGKAESGTAEGEERYGSSQECYAHPQAEPGYECTQCQRYLCPACVRESPVRGGVRPVLICSACGGLAKPLESRKTWTPFYRDMGQVLTAPLKGHALLYFGILSFLQVLKIPAAFGWMWGLAAVFILTVFQTSFYLHLIQQVANGSYDFPEWPESSNFVDMIVSVLKVIFVSVVSLIPAILVAVVTGVGALGLLLGGAAGGHALAALGPVAAAFLVLGLFYLFYLPMCITIVAVFDTVLPALNPFLILKIMVRIGMPYVAAIAVLAAMTIWDATFSAFLSPVPILGKVLAAPVSVYCSLVSCYVLGRVVHENEERIGWH
jgi:hypothetical protein